MDLQAGDLGSCQSRSIVTRYEQDRVIGRSIGPVNEKPFGGNGSSADSDRGSVSS